MSNTRSEERNTVSYSYVDLFFNEKRVTNTRPEQHHKRPHEEPLPSLNTDRRWRGDGARHLPHQGGWPHRGDVVIGS